ncbi:hypothetical protein [Microbacterium sp. bgisy207]|uniref:hypothetical protein n=1 Tax=Microbacterium sp. bgisy207 TaxID=3413800 RepID=UPI003EC066B1
MASLTNESARDFLLEGGSEQAALTRTFLQAVWTMNPHLRQKGGPYRSTRGLGAWPLSFYGVGQGQLGDYRSTLMLEEDGTYSHFLIDEDGEMEIETPRLGPDADATSTDIGPSFFVQWVVRGEADGSFVIDRPAWEGPSGQEPMVDVLARSLVAVGSGVLPPIFTRDAELRR